MSVPTDEIYEKYKQKAISEINDLWHDLQEAAGEQGVAIVGTGRPLADIFMLKYAPTPAEVHEGVAFYGRAGNAIVKSLQRLHVDALAVYGTNCRKLAGVTETEEQAYAWLARELHIVGPKLLVVMGEQAGEFLNSLAFPLAEPIEAEVGALQRFTPTIEALFVPDIDDSLDEQAAKTRFWNAFKLIGPWWAELPPY
jgi:uracil-DNA glycosylase family 4